MDLPIALIVDDDGECIRTVSRLLRPHYSLVVENTAERALEILLHGREFDVIVCDMGMDGWSGRDLYRRLERHGNPHTARFVMLSGEDVRVTQPAFAAQLGARLLRKPVDVAVLLSVLSTVRASGSRSAPTVPVGPVIDRHLIG
jgi:putative two-component system response regulator